MHGSFTPRIAVLGTTSAAALISKLLPEGRHVIPARSPKGSRFSGASPRSAMLEAARRWMGRALRLSAFGKTQKAPVVSTEAL
jgi:hypothetical protein